MENKKSLEDTILECLNTVNPIGNVQNVTDALLYMGNGLHRIADEIKEIKMIYRNIQINED